MFFRTDLVSSVGVPLGGASEKVDHIISYKILLYQSY